MQRPLLGLFLLLQWAFFGLAVAGSGQNPIKADSGGLVQTFTLRHVFYRDLEDSNTKSATFTTIHLPEQHDTAHAATTSKLHKQIRVRNTQDHPPFHIGEYDYDTLPRPEITDKDTVVNLAMMTSDAYLFNSSDSAWLNLTFGFNDRLPFGYESDGLRGHVFSNIDNSTVIVAFKGSSINPLDKTRNKDRLNDNLLFSCCCASQRPAPYWYGEVCSCRQEVFKCNSSCLTSELTQEDRYYAAASSIMHNVTQHLYPSAAVWTTGHSLGGSMASLMGLKFQIPAVTFEAPPDRLAAQRLGLVGGSAKSGITAPPAYHFGNTGDPIYLGACNGFFSACAAAGYDFESQCFTGKRCIYDTQSDKGWRLSVANHRIGNVIENVLKAYDKVPECVDEEDECADCFNWSFD